MVIRFLFWMVIAFVLSCLLSIMNSKASDEDLFKVTLELELPVRMA